MPDWPSKQSPFEHSDEHGAERDTWTTVAKIAPEVGWKTIAKATPEATAEFLAGKTERLSMDMVDPQLKAAMLRQHASLRHAFYHHVVPVLHRALWQDSPQTARRLNDLAAASAQGDANASRLLAAMLNELVKQALG